LVACDNSDYGCGGGFIQNAWVYLENYGTVSEECNPYTSGTTGVDGACLKACANKQDDFTKYKCKSKTRVLAATPDQIKTEIYRAGPMETRFDVYEDFMSYKGGVYQTTSTVKKGGHAIKILGWGHDQPSGLNYWLCANSWGKTWGEKGYFKIKIGDKSGIAQ
jgi:cathepsin B